MRKTIKKWFIACTGSMILHAAQAQTDIDAIMMEKNAFCAGLMAGGGQWEDYWEGTTKRDNKNLGTVSNQWLGVMGNYGISNKLNILFSLPYVKTKASAGQLKGQKGLQDISLAVKWKALSKRMGDARLSIFGIGMFSAPTSNYQADYLPLSIGPRSRTASLRLMADYHYQFKWFATASATWNYRGNIEIDRNAYYTDRLILSNKVEMPNTSSVNIRAGYRTQWLIAELVFNKMQTHGGFDISRNNMPFPSNEIHATQLGVNGKYVFRKIPALSLNGGVHQVLTGRNTGQSLLYNAGVFYVLDFSKKERKTSHPQPVKK
jgi:hypothetical protein